MTTPSRFFWTCPPSPQGLPAVCFLHPAVLQRVLVSTLTLPNFRLPLSGNLALRFCMVLAAHCALRLPWIHLAIMLLPAKGVMMWFPATTNYVISLRSPVDKLIWVSRWNWVAMSPPITAAPVQLTFWFQTGSSHPCLILQFFWKRV